MIVYDTDTFASHVYRLGKQTLRYTTLEEIERSLRNATRCTILYRSILCAFPLNLDILNTCGFDQDCERVSL